MHNSVETKIFAADAFVASDSYLKQRIEKNVNWKKIPPKTGEKFLAHTHSHVHGVNV